MNHKRKTNNNCSTIDGRKQNTFGHSLKEWKTFLILWSTQSLSQLGSQMTSFALGLWLFRETGSALQTALLSVCSYAPYVLMSIFAGALSDRWDKKKVMLISDTLAACMTVSILVLLKLDRMSPLYMYGLNAVSGLMNTIQQPASDVAMTLITPKSAYQKTSSLRAISQSMVTILHPIFATALFAAGGMDSVIALDLATFAVAFFALLCLVKLPQVTKEEGKQEALLAASRAGLQYLRKNPLILYLILFLAGVNLVASTFDVALTPYVLLHSNGGETVLGWVTSCAGIATLTGSLIMLVLPKPKNRIRVITLTMLYSLTIENFVLAFTREPVLWCIGQFLGWVVVPIMSTNLDVILRTTIPVEMQGRVYSCRNTLQFFTIPIGLLLGGWMVDRVWEPFMAHRQDNLWLTQIFGTGAGSGASIMMFVLGVAGAVVCTVFGWILKRYTYEE